MLLPIECRRGVKQKPEVKGGVVFMGRMSTCVGKALRYISLYKVHFDGTDPQPHSLS